MPKDTLSGLSAAKLRVLLSISIVLVIIIASVSFWFFRNQLEGYATEVRKANTEASISSKDVSKIKELEKDLAENAVAIKRAEKIVGDSKFYQYQDQIIADLNAYAGAAGVKIESYSFLDATSGAAAGGTATPSTPAGDGAVPAGLKTITVSITLKNPINYAALMRFVHAIETNLTKMQLTGISMARVSQGSQDVTTTPLNIEVYTR